MLVYHDGDEVGRIPMSKAYVPRAGSFFIGGRAGFSFQGIVDEVGLFETMLGQGNIRDIMENGLKVPASVVLSMFNINVTWGRIKQQ